ncbi:MAG: hypothetical protein WCJ24_03450 [Candidatus Saccharibacteria bacterium]
MIRRTIIGISSTLMALVFMSLPGIAHAQGNVYAAVAANDAKQAVCEGAGITAGGGNGCSTTGQIDISALLRTALTILSFIAGLAAVVMIIISGIKFITSQGDPANIASARNTILYAIVGLVVVAISQIIVRFVITKSSAALN